MSILHEPEKRMIDFKRISEFYLVQKLMMIIFEANKKVHESAVDNLDENFTDREGTLFVRLAYRLRERDAPQPTREKRKKIRPTW